MRTLKKTLCLVLALVMVLGLCAVNAVAAYSDADKITYTEAVDVLSAVGVLKGDERGFRPLDGLTRAEACKIIAYLDGAEDLTSATSFTDAKGHWAESYIAYCASQGYVNGIGNNKFNPDGELTGSAFSKMLLGVLGYDATIEGFGAGANDWEIAVAKLVKTTGLAGGIAKFNGTKAITREEAAQLGLNALFADCVDYASRGTKVTINGVEIATGATNAEPVTVAAAAKWNAIDATLDGTKSIVQLGEMLYNGLLYIDGTPSNGQEGYTWMYKASANAVARPVSDFVVAGETVIGTSSDGTALYAATGRCLTRRDNTNAKYIATLNTTTLNTTFEAYVNGAKVTATDAAASTYWWDGAAGTVKYGNPGTDINGNGVLISLVDTDRNAATAEKVYYTLYTVDTVVKAPVVKTNAVNGLDYIYIDLGTTDIGTSSVNTVLAAQVTGYENLAPYDVVTVIAMADGTYEITKVTPVTAKATAATGTTLTIDGKAVKTAAAADASWTGFSNFSADTYFYYDAYGYGIFAVPVTTVANDYLMTLGAGNIGDFMVGIGKTGNVAEVILDTGAAATIKINQIGTKVWGRTLAASDVANNTIYAYTVNDDGSYNLIAATNVSSGTGTAINKGVATIAAGSGGTALKCNNATKYVVKSNITGLYSVVTGYASIPSMTGITALAVNDATTGFAKVVFVNAGAPVSATTTDVAYLLSTTATTVYKANGTVDYYTFPAIINGEVGELKTASNDLHKKDSTYTTGLGNGGDIAAKTLLAVKYTDGVVAPEGLTTLTTGSGIVEITSTTIAAAADGLVTIGSTVYNYTDATKVYVINSAGTVVEEVGMTGYDAGTYTITGVTASYGKWAVATSAEKVTLTAIYLQA